MGEAGLCRFFHTAGLGSGRRRPALCGGRALKVEHQGQLAGWLAGWLVVPNVCEEVMSIVVTLVAEMAIPTAVISMSRRRLKLAS